MTDKPETPGVSELTTDQRAELERRYHHRYLAVADGSKGGHTPGKTYGRGGFATSLKTRRT